MQLVVPVDVADVIQQALNAAGVTACAEPLPRGLESSIPITLVQPIGGTRSDVVVDARPVRLYTWAETDAEADAEARAATAALMATVGTVVGGTSIYRVDATALPYPAHDPEHPTLARCAQTARVWLRASVEEQQQP